MTITETMTESCVSFQAIADGLGLEGVENLTLSLSGPPNVQLTTASLHICIQDSDGNNHYIVSTQVTFSAMFTLLCMQWKCTDHGCIYSVFGISSNYEHCGINKGIIIIEQSQYSDIIIIIFARSSP